MCLGHRYRTALNWTTQAREGRICFTFDRFGIMTNVNLLAISSTVRYLSVCCLEIGRCCWVTAGTRGCQHACMGPWRWTSPRLLNFQLFAIDFFHPICPLNHGSQRSHEQDGWRGQASRRWEQVHDTCKLFVVETLLETRSLLAKRKSSRSGISVDETWEQDLMDLYVSNFPRIKYRTMGNNRLTPRPSRQLVPQPNPQQHIPKLHPHAMEQCRHRLPTQKARRMRQ